MLFNSFAFIFAFFPACYCVYWALRSLRRDRAAIAVLFTASYLFYVMGERNYPYLIIVSIVFNFFASYRIRVSESRARATAWVITGVTGNLAALAFFKYTNFVATSLSGIGIIKPVSWHVELPIGISFFTFTQLAFLADVYRRKAAEHDPANYGLFVTFFPHLIAGPILHHAEMMPQFSRPKRRAPIECLADGLPMFAIGLFKKTVLADSVAPTVNVLFGLGSSGHPVTLLPAWGAAFAYAVQIYFDFSGYSDMAIGLSRCLGIDLPINFNSPYKARSISDFWRRWHITLSRFLRDYLYIPLGGNRRGAARRYLNLLVTMLLGGIWHGAGWTFVLWGLLHGLYLAVANAMTSVLGRFRLRINPFLGSIGTLIAVLVAWIPFRAPNVATTLQIWKGMLGWNGVALPSDWAGVPSLARVLHLHTSQFGVDGSSTLTVAALFVACTFLPNSQEILREMQPGLDSPGYQASGNPPRYRIFVLQRNLFWAVAIGVSLALSLRTIGDYSAFIYFQF